MIQTAMIEFVSATQEHVTGICSVVNRSRVTWKVYFPEPDVNAIDAYVSFCHEYPSTYLATVAVQDGIVVGGIGIFVERLYQGIVIGQNTLLVVDPTLAPFVKYSVLCRLINTAHVYAKEQGCNRIAWSLGVGEWAVVQKILERKHKAIQVGVSLNSEIV